jgi:hypothetical protein
LRKSMLPPVFACGKAEFTLKTHLNSYKCSQFSYLEMLSWGK